MYKVWQYRIKDKKKEQVLRFYMHLEKNLYNVTLCYLKVYHRKKGKIDFTDTEFVRRARKTPNFRLLGYALAKKTVYDIYGAYMRYLKGMTSCPSFLPKDGYHSLTIPWSALGKEKLFPILPSFQNGKELTFDHHDPLIDDWLLLMKKEDFRPWEIIVPDALKKKDIRQIRYRLDPTGTLLAEFVFREEESYLPAFKSAYRKFAGIDLGMDNAAAIAFFDNTASLYDGKYLKSVIHLYDRKHAECLAGLSKQGLKTSKKKRAIERNLLNRKKSFVEKTSSRIVKDCKNKGVELIVIGKNPMMKQGGIKNDHLGTRTKRAINTTYEAFPMMKLAQRIAEKAKEEGISALYVDEAFTSKASFYDGDKPFSGENFSGTRVKRGLYKTKEGKCINADINAALNILSKCSAVNKEQLSLLRRSGPAIPSRVQAF